MLKWRYMSPSRCLCFTLFFYFAAFSFCLGQDEVEEEIDVDEPITLDAEEKIKIRTVGDRKKENENLFSEEVDFVKLRQNQERVLGEPRLNILYSQGEYLAYDCRKRHFACINKESFEFCAERREIAKGREFFQFPCAPLKRFETQEKCFEVQLKMIASLRRKDFCRNPAGKKDGALYRLY